ncbi:unnamed protein product [Paramecium sonneborni]|uniref:Uncharacterized protein n=1 Tax=Paramecium sonneborni TaxID=65129 RepID=A0A8S1P679_9CILI|nr:unnamed protein product [Paramecium sonneborni]
MMFQIQDNLRKQSQEDQKVKNVSFCFDRNVIHTIKKSPFEYLKKKQSRHQNRKIYQQIRGEEKEELISSDEDTQDFYELDENQQYYSIIEWKKLQDERLKQMTGNNLINSQDLNDSSKVQKLPLKSCLKKIKKDIYLYYEELFGKISNDQLQTVLSSEKLQLNEKQIKQCIIVTEFNNIMNDDDDEISINLDELDDFIEQRNIDQKKNKNYNITEFDNIRKKVDQNRLKNNQ